MLLTIILIFFIKQDIAFSDKIEVFIESFNISYEESVKSVCAF